MPCWSWQYCPFKLKTWKPQSVADRILIHHHTSHPSRSVFLVYDQRHCMNHKKGVVAGICCLWTPRGTNKLFLCMICFSSEVQLKQTKSIIIRLFREPDTQNWKSSDTREPVNNFYIKQKLASLWKPFWYHVINHKGNWLGTFLDTFWMKREKFTRAGFERATSGLTCRCSTNWAN